MTKPIPKKAKHGIIMGLPVLRQNTWQVNRSSTGVDFVSLGTTPGHPWLPRRHWPPTSPIFLSQACLVWIEAREGLSEKVPLDLMV
jgi:hypothetical protein